MSYDRDWRAEANCLEVDPQTMQPDAASAEDVDAAKRICLGCPVRAECRELAESQNGSEGISAYGIHDGQWWGLPPAEPAAGHCQWDGTPLPAQTGGQGRPRKFCSDVCRWAARDAARRAAALSA